MAKNLETLKLPTTAQEALESWRLGAKYLDDPDPGASDPESVFQDAARVIQLAREENIPLEQLIPDGAERKRIKDDAAELDKILRAEHDGWPDLEIPEPTRSRCL